MTVAIAGVVVLTSAAGGDDRLLFQSATAEPYVMTLIDTSGSMALQTDSPEFATGGIKTNRGSADDPSSRLYLAKSALYEVIKGLRPGINLGFAHFNQRDFVVAHKHWLYTRSPATDDDDLPWFDILPFPAAGDPVQFGRPVVDGDDFSYRSCGDPDDAGTAAERIQRLNLFPKLGDAGTDTTQLFIMYPDASGINRRYHVTFKALAAGELGGESLAVEVQVRQVNGFCGTRRSRSWTRTLTFVPYYTEDNQGVAFSGGFDYLSLNAADEDSIGTPVVHNFGLGDIFDATDYEDCPGTDEGWEANGNASHDMTYADAPDPLGRTCAGDCLNRGDVVPWDWTDFPRQPPDPGFEFSSQDEVLRRLAPNVFVPGEFDVDVNGEPIPDFRIARYFENVPVNGRLPLKARFEGTPPLAVSRLARTPLARMMESFAAWYDDWLPVASDPDTGDRNFACRQRFAILLTDGVETCDGNPTMAAQELRDRGIRVFVVGFGENLGFGDLQPIADAGGTGDQDTDGDGFMDCEEFGLCPGPILAADRQALIDALNRVFGAIEPEPTSFASAAVPQAQAESQDSIFLTSFAPVDGRSVWPGSLLHFSRPLPLTTNDDGLFVPDTSRSCAGLDPQIRCLAWDAGERLLSQAPTLAETMSDLKLGFGTDQRRVFYAQERLGDAVPATKQLFEPPSSDLARLDLWLGMDIDVTLGDTESEAAAEVIANSVIRRTLARKTAPVPDDPGQTFEYILGDIFHSDPLVLGAPERFPYFVADLESNGRACDDPGQPNPGYRCFFSKHRRRRKIAFAGSNDGELHAFDAGFFNGQVVDGRLQGEFDLGTGQELFAFVPRTVLPRVRELAGSRSQNFTVDGPPRVDDVFIDPQHTGTPTDRDRVWRTVLVGGLREGGRGYYALDVTQPDHLTTPPGQNPDLPVQLVPDSLGNYVPSCLKSYSAAECGPVEFPSVLWEFTDTRDEDGNATAEFDGADLGFTWSTPNTGRIEVMENGTRVAKYVAIFGGGIDPKKPNLVGDWLYMVDIETGKILYKRELMGSAPSEPAAVDTNQDGLIDRVYIGTTLGFLYKVDLSAAVELVDTGMPGIGKRIIDPAWEPFPIFDTGSRPIYYPPSVIFVAQLGRFALAFGTGDRQDLWLETDPAQQGRFYMILDDNFTTATGLTEAAYQGVTLAAAPGGDFLLDPSAGTGSEHGWYLILTDNERMITPAFSVSGVTIFSTFVPDFESEIVDGERTCSRTGTSNVFTVFTTSANPVGSNKPRSRNVQGVLSSIFDETSATGEKDEESGPTADDLTDELKDVMEALRELFPANCKFANITVNLKAIRNDTGVEFIAPVPVCVVEKNWKEF